MKTTSKKENKKYPKRTYKNCFVCGKEFWVYTYRLAKGEGKYCSRECSNPHTLIKEGHPSFKYWDNKKRPDLKDTKANDTMFKKGFQPWNKGIDWIEMKGEGNPLWKGNEVGYVSLHSWVRRKLGKPNKCEFCGTTNASRFDWANKSLEYKRDVTDWLRLCPKCHSKYDHKMGWGVASQKFPSISYEKK